MKGVLFFIAIIIIATSCSAQSKYPKLDQYFKVLDDDNKFMGSVSISRRDTVIYSNVIGYSNVEADEKATIDSRYKIGSISKSFTAVLVMQALEKGLLTLNTTLDNYFPSIPNSNKITIEHMLRHRSGIPNYFDVSNMTKLTDYNRRSVMVDTILGRYKKNVIIATDSVSSYSNSNYLLLTYILEDVYDKKFAEILDVNIVKPLGLKNTLMPEGQEGCYSYMYAGDRWDVEKETHPSAIMGAGGIVSTPIDLNIFYSALFSGELISEESLDDMTRIDKSSMLPLGMGLFDMSNRTKVGYGHTGGINGYVSVSVYYPADETAITITSNGMNYQYNEIMKVLFNAIYDIPFDIPEFKSVTLSEEDVAKYRGVYRCLSADDTITISNQKSILVLTKGSSGLSYRFTSIAKDTFEFSYLGMKNELIFNVSKGVITSKTMGLTHEYLNIDSEKYAAEILKIPMEISEEELQKYLGVYATSKLPMKITVTKKGNVLVAQGSGQLSFDLVPIDEHTFEYAAANIVLVFNTEKGVMTLKQGGMDFEMQREL